MITPVAQPETLLVTTDAARRLGVSTRQIWQLIDSGRLPVVLKEIPGRTGRWGHVSPQDLDRLRDT